MDLPLAIPEDEEHDGRMEIREVGELPRADMMGNPYPELLRWTLRRHSPETFVLKT
jgi:hypothetical protein